MIKKAFETTKAKRFWKTDQTIQSRAAQNIQQKNGSYLEEIRVSTNSNRYLIAPVYMKTRLENLIDNE